MTTTIHPTFGEQDFILLKLLPTVQWCLFLMFSGVFSLCVSKKLGY